MSKTDNQINEFLRLIFDEDFLYKYGLYFIIATIGQEGLRSKFFQEIDKAVQFVNKLPKINTYFSLGLVAYETAKKAPYKKGLESEIIAVAGFNGDIDFEHPGQNSQKKYPTKENAYHLALNGQLIHPTIINMTGHGYQPLHLFNEPFVIEDIEDREEARRMSAKYQAAFKFSAMGKGYHVDQIGNLDHLIRFPYTYNVKDKPVFVEIINIQGDVLSNLEDWEDLLIHVPDEKTEYKKSELLQSGDKNPYDITLDENVVAPPEKLQQILDIDTHFLMLWNKQLNNKKKDTSLSGYDMSIANELAKWGWTPQEIANCIIQFRQKHKRSHQDVKKALRLSYINSLILKSREQVIKSKNLEGIEEVHNQVVKRRMEGVKLEGPEKQAATDLAKTKLRSCIKLSVDKMIKYNSQPAFYELILNSGSKQTIPIGVSNNLIQFSNFKRIIFDYCNVSLEHIKATEWAKVLTNFTEIMEEVDTAEETRELDSLKNHVQTYLQEWSVWDDKDDAVLAKRPFRYNDKVFVFFRKLRDFIVKHQNVQITETQLGLNLGRLDCYSVQLNFKDLENEKRSSQKRCYNVTKIYNEMVQN